jgi:hypothetical protein
MFPLYARKIKSLQGKSPATNIMNYLMLRQFISFFYSNRRSRARKSLSVR